MKIVGQKERMGAKLDVRTARWSALCLSGLTQRMRRPS